MSSFTRPARQQRQCPPHTTTTASRQHTPASHTTTFPRLHSLTPQTGVDTAAVKARSVSGRYRDQEEELLSQSYGGAEESFFRLHQFLHLICQHGIVPQTTLRVWRRSIQRRRRGGRHVHRRICAFAAIVRRNTVRGCTGAILPAEAESTRNPRQHITAALDASSIYGVSIKQSLLRNTGIYHGCWAIQETLRKDAVSGTRRWYAASQGQGICSGTVAAAGRGLHTAQWLTRSQSALRRTRSDHQPQAWRSPTCA